MRSFYFVPVMLALSTAAYGQFGQWLSAEDIQSHLVGNTITGVEDGEQYIEYLRPNGTISGQSPSGRYTGAWRISSNQMCFFYNGEPGEAKQRDWDCSNVRIEGDKVFWSETAPSEASTLVKGDPNGL